MFSRRTFIKYTGGTALTLFASGKLGGLSQAIAQITGGTLDPCRSPIRHANADPAGDAAGSNDPPPGRKPADYYRSR